ncbi:MAG: class III poly(R)-hydroxyalkanoic acid synthase subunit PhaE [Gammaproteobacteria bacterium]|nr:class III poly(R)-hydroxyalkanoic acid synthase subunit PhaE [Gammaproteobacteria bacterium]
MSEFDYWSHDWMDTQRKYWENWAEMGRNATDSNEPAKSPWESALDHWWQTVSPTAPDQTKELMGRILSQGKAFLAMSDGFIKNLQQAGGGSADWTEVFERSISDLQGSFSVPVHPDGDDTLHRMMAFWEMPMDSWQRMVSSLSLVPGDLLRNLLNGDSKASMDEFLSTPGLGHTRETQAKQQEMVRLVLEYQKALQEYQQFFSNLGINSVDRMRKKLEGMNEQDPPIESARALYDLWVASCEEVYGELVTTPEYACLQGHLLNTLMAAKRQSGIMVDEFLDTMNMPTRSELQTLQDRMQESRRENKRLHSEVDAIKKQLADVSSIPPRITETKAKPKARTTSGKKAKRKVAPKKRAVVKKRAATRSQQTKSDE